MNYDQLKLLKVSLATAFLAVLISLLAGFVSDSHAQQKDQSAAVATGIITTEDLKPVADARKIATRVESVEVEKSGNGIVIAVKADGMINDFKSLTIESTSKLPARIVFDISNTKSPFKKEQIVQANTEWVSKVRHYSSNDKIRIVLDTKNEYLKSFSTKPVSNGLLITVGPAEIKTSDVSSKPIIQKETLASADKTSEKPISSDSKPVSDVLKKKSVLTDSKPAWVNKIDFSSEESGKSTISIGTTKPVEYNIIKATEKLLHLRLNNTNIPVKQRRPLITTRFNSAVDRITPVLKPVKKNTSIVAIELREAVPYVVEQSDTLLMVHFEASSILPKPEKEAGLPEWKEVLTNATALPVETETKEPVTKQVAEAKKTLLEPAKQYTGEKIALDFFDTDIKNVFRILQEVSGKNFAIDKSVTGKVTLSLEKPVPWDQVLDLVLKMNQLGMVYEGDIIRISPIVAIAKEEELRQVRVAADQKSKEQLGELVVEYIPINYSNAKSEILPHLDKIKTKDRGTISVDERTNIIIITDLAEVISKAKEIAKKLDKATPQVMIEARIVEASTNFSKEIGISWGSGVGVQPSSLIPGTYGTLTSIDNAVGVGTERGFNQLGGTYGVNTGINFPTAPGLTDIASIGFNFVKLGGTPLLLNAKLQAMEAQGEGKIISSPKIATLDNKKATISQGLEYPYFKLDPSGNTTLEFKKIDLLLSVTPHVTSDNRISMIIEIKKDDLGQIITGVQSFTTKYAKTELLINDGETLVIGGIIKTTKSSDTAGIPLLSKIPILGWLFKNDGKTDTSEELLIFITPKIVQLEQRSASLN